jgi:hypothetical protein
MEAEKMNAEKILNLKSGPELNDLVSLHLSEIADTGYSQMFKPYSTVISDAMYLLDIMICFGTTTISVTECLGIIYTCTVHGDKDYDHRQLAVTGSSIAETISKAFLLFSFGLSGEYLTGNLEWEEAS